MAGAPHDLLDSRALVGRSRELAAGRSALSAAGASAVLFVHGPGGIGKTALLAALVAEAEEAGRSVWHIDGRELPPGTEALDDLLVEIATAARPLIAIDSFELVEPWGDYLRERLLPALPSGAALAIAGRNPPAREWLGPSPEASFADLRLGPLADADAYELVGSQGVVGPPADALVAWAHGQPLALDLGARLAAEGDGWDPGSEAAPERLVGAIVRQLGEADVDAGHLPALGAAAIARSTTPALLAAALPEHDAAREWEWLTSRSFVEPVGEGVALHSVLRDAVRANLRRRAPTLEADLKRRIADHVYAMAERSGELARALDLSHLIDDPRLRWGFAWEASASWYVDTPRPGDAVEIDRLLAAAGPTGLEDGWRATRGFFERMPELGAVVKDGQGEIHGFTFVPTTAVDDPQIEASPLLGPILRHARGRTPRGEGVVMPYMCDLTGDPLSGLVGMLANAALLRASRSNPRYVYMTIREEVEAGQRFARQAGAERVPELDAETGRGRLLCWAIDFGPGGFLANQRELVYRELNLEPPPRPPERCETALAEQVRDALRSLDSPVALARSPLASGAAVEERAASVRERLACAAERAFGEATEERLLREVLRRGYLDPAPSHEAAAEELFLSRSTYFRRLTQAVDRLAEYIAAQDRA